MILYRAVRRLASALNYDFSFSTEAQQRPIAKSPEIILMSLLIVSLKLFQGFENENLHASKGDGLMSLAIDWDQWMESRPLSRPSLVDMMKKTSDEVYTMTESDLDDYMDWYEDMWTKDKSHEQCESLQIQRERV